ncbi:MAG TPA: NYN domain-containing protein [Steroidobacteraceae bacterium]|nr:NYN domain-containing protein [Steroidobacteraceae bacterium]
MSPQTDNRIIALFCDFENIALGVRDAHFPQLDIDLVIQRVLLKGSIVVRKAYCDWTRYKEFKVAMHQAGFELIDIPHVSQSGKNSADIRMVVDALDLCYTKPHVDTFVIVSGDSDFSPLVTKLLENNKSVIGVGVKNSTSDMLVQRCSEFIYYDDLVRELKRPARRAKKAPAKAAPKAKAAPVEEEPPAHPPAQAEAPADGKEHDKKQEAFDLVLETLEALIAERGDEEKAWSSMVKQTLKRRRPGFNERYYGFRSFNELLEEAAARRLLTLEREGKSGGYVVRFS